MTEKVINTIRAQTARKKYLLDSGASHKVEWLSDDMAENCQENLERVKLQLAVGEVDGWMQHGGDTVYLDPSESSGPQLDEMAELLPLGRLCKEYSLMFEFNGVTGALKHELSGEQVKVKVIGDMPYLEKADYEALKRVVKVSTFSFRQLRRCRIVGRATSGGKHRRSRLADAIRSR